MDMEPSKRSDKHKRPKEGIKTTTPPTTGQDDGLLPTPNRRDTWRKDRQYLPEVVLTGVERHFGVIQMYMGRNQGGEKPCIDDFPPVNNPGVIVPAGVRALGAEVPPPPEPRV